MSAINATVKITLEGVHSPKVWRALSMPLDITFEHLHLIIQAAFGWEGTHLYAFCERGLSDLLTINCPIDADAVVTADAVKIRPLLINLYNRKKFVDKDVPFKYIYDYGDGWVHQMDVVEIEYDSPTLLRLIGGGGACPPEDSGGPQIYERLKSSTQLANQNGLTVGFDPAHYDGALYKARLRDLERYLTTQLPNRS